MKNSVEELKYKFEEISREIEQKYKEIENKEEKMRKLEDQSKKSSIQVAELLERKLKEEIIEEKSPELINRNIQHQVCVCVCCF